MNILIFKLKLKDKLLTNQSLIAIISKLAYLISLLIPDDKIKIRLGDYYLRFNFDKADTRKVLNTIVGIFRKMNTSKTETTAKTQIIRSILIKKYVSPLEKGLILVSFENQLQKLAELPSFNELEKKYTLIFVPSWQPFFSISLYMFLSKITEPFWIMPSSSRDMKLCDTVGPLCLPLPFQASSWVNGDKFALNRGARDIDIIMLANFSEYKRHWLLFEALAELDDKFNVIIAGRPLGKRNRAALIEEAASFGVAERVNIVENPSNEEIIDMLSRSKIFCALSHKEGSYIAVAEALFADIPVAIFEDAIIGSKDYINAQTGVLLNKQTKLSLQLNEMINKFDKFEAAVWAKDNISAKVNCLKLNSILEQHSLASGLEWTENILPFYCENFNFHHYGQDSSISTELLTISENYGLVIT